ncbi:MAG: AAA family ATPase [Hyphomicrobiales bacterium]
MTDISHSLDEKQGHNEQVALKLANQGFHVFPCRPCDTPKGKAKSPCGGIKWREASTTDSGEIKGWWSQLPKAAIGIDVGKSRLLVIDCDRHDNETDGVRAFGDLMDKHGSNPDDCPIVATPNKGVHYYFKLPEGKDHGNGRGNLPDGIDVRGSGGYVIAPETIMADGRDYELVGDIQEAPVVPDWLWSIITASKAVDMPEPASVVESQPVPIISGDEQLDGAGLGEAEELLNYVPADCGYDDWYKCLMAVHAATGGSEAGFNLVDRWSAGGGSKYDGSKALRKKWASFKGTGINSRSLAAIARNYGADLQAIALKHNDVGGVSDAEKARSAEIAASLMANAGGAGLCAKEAEQGNIAAKAESAAIVENGGEISPVPYQWVEPENLPRRAWLYGRSLIRKYLSVTVAPGGVGKSTEVIAQTLAMVTGRQLLNKFVRGRLRVWYINLEDPMEELQLRIQATCQYYEIEPTDLGGRLFVNSGRDQSLCMAVTERTGTKIYKPVVDNIIAKIKADKIDVLVIDPFVSSHSVSENDNNAIDAVAKMWGKIAGEGNCAIHLVHHSRKGTPHEALTADSSRGAKALVDASRDTRVFNKMTKDEGDRYGVENHRSYFRVHSDKGNNAPPSSGGDWYKIESVILPNGEDVGVVVPWKQPKPFDDMTVQDLKKAQIVVGDGDYRESIQSKDWVGYVIGEALGIETGKGLKKDQMTTTQILGRKKVSGYLNAWIKNGAFVIEEGQTEDRKSTKFVRVGELCEG